MQILLLINPLHKKQFVEYVDKNTFSWISYKKISSCATVQKELN